MPDVFISYSRKDKEFARRLHDALADNGRDIWIDFEDIPLSADWWAEIRAGIEGSNVFIFIISPDSVASEVCAKEVGCGIELHKRMVPILHREVDANKVAPEVASLNWVFFRENDNFEGALTQLISTMDTDLEWLKAHTRLTVRAMEWERRNRNESLLLRGDDLAEAELLLIQADKQPPLTDLQREYIWHSRQSAVKRQRLIIGAITLGLVVAVILGVVAFMNFLRADREFQRAEAGAATAWAAVDIAQIERENARVAQTTAEAGQQIAWHAVGTAEASAIRAATAEALAYSLRDQAASRELAADAVIHLDKDPELSVLLAMQALKAAQTEEAEDALRQALNVVRPGNNAQISAASLEQLQTLAQNWVSRRLTNAECKKYLHQEACS